MEHSVQPIWGLQIVPSQGISRNGKEECFYPMNSRLDRSTVKGAPRASRHELLKKSKSAEKKGPETVFPPENRIGGYDQNSTYRFINHMVLYIPILQLP